MGRNGKKRELCLWLLSNTYWGTSMLMYSFFTWNFHPTILVLPIFPCAPILSWLASSYHLHLCWGNPPLCSAILTVLQSSVLVADCFHIPNSCSHVKHSLEKSRTKSKPTTQFSPCVLFLYRQKNLSSWLTRLSNISQCSNFQHMTPLHHEKDYEIYTEETRMFFKMVH